MAVLSPYRITEIEIRDTGEFTFKVSINQSDPYDLCQSTLILHFLDSFSNVRWFL